MNKAAELRAVRIARKRAKPRLRVLLIYVSHNLRARVLQACILQPHFLYGGVAGIKGAQVIAIKAVLGKIGLPIKRRTEPLHAQLGKCLCDLMHDGIATAKMPP